MAALKHIRDLTRAVEGAGYPVLSCKREGKHYKLRVTLPNGDPYCAIIASSPHSTWRLTRNVITELNRASRGISNAHHAGPVRHT